MINIKNYPNTQSSIRIIFKNTVLVVRIKGGLKWNSKLLAL